MGLANVSDIVAELIAGGRDEHEPAAVVENGTLPEQRVITTQLARLPSQIARHRVASPAVIATGEVVRLRERAGAELERMSPRNIWSQRERFEAQLPLKTSDGPVFVTRCSSQRNLAEKQAAYRGRVPSLSDR